MSTWTDNRTRRQFVALLPGLLATVAGLAAWSGDRGSHECVPAPGARRAAGPRHPNPRPGIDGSRVLRKAQLKHNPDAAPAFDMVRQIPQIADGIRCHCPCNELPEYRSLLNCYEGEGMAQHCEICQGQGKLAFRLHKKGRTLAAIRAAIDEEFG